MAEMNALKERGEHERHEREHAASARNRVAPQSERRARRWLQCDAEQQAAADRDKIQHDITDITDPKRHEPLDPFVERADEQTAEQRQDDDRPVAERQPRGVEQACQQPILDEMKRLDDIDGAVAGAKRARENDPGRERGDERAVAKPPLFGELSSAVPDPASRCVRPRPASRPRSRS